MPGAERTAIGITGNHGPVPAAEFEDLSGVAEAIPVSKPYKLVSRRGEAGQHRGRSGRRDGGRERAGFLRRALRGGKS